MNTYTGAVITVVLLSSIALIYILNKNNVLNINMVAAIGISSVAISIAVPFLFVGLNNFFSHTGSFLGPNIGVICAFFTTLVIYVMLTMILAVLSSMLISEQKVKEIWCTVKKRFSSDRIKVLRSNVFELAAKIRSKFEALFSKIVGYNAPAGIAQAAQTVENPKSEASQTGELAQEYKESNIIKNEESLAAESLAYIVPSQDENIFEKSVDSNQNIDKMGIETLVNFDTYVEQDKNICTLNNEPTEDSVLKLEGADESAVSDEVYDDVAEELVLEEYHSFYGTNDANIPENSETYDKDVSYERAFNGQEETVLEAAATEDIFIQDQENSKDISIDIEMDDEEAAYGLDDNSDRPFSVDEYVDKAFKLKECGDIEGSILHYMYALDKNPDKDLIFWIILDICVLYKELGQGELAGEILDSYITNYGDVMDPIVKAEIIKNL